MRPVFVLMFAAMAAAAQSPAPQPPRPTGGGWRKVETPKPAQPPLEATPKAAEAGKPVEGADTPTFKAGTTLVRVDVQVVNNKQPLPGLKSSDFVLKEEGVERQIEYFGQESEPLQVLLLLDVSGSMGKLLREMAMVAQEALSSLKPEDQIAVALFSRRVEFTQELTGEKRLAVVALQDAPMDHNLGAGTAINDSILQVTDYLKQQPPFAGRRALIILTDNGGVHYQLPDEKVVRALSENDTVLNAIVAPGTKPPPALPKGADVNTDFTPANVFRLAEDTGGEVLRADKAGARFQEMLERIRNRYSLGITATAAPEGTFRKLQVELSADTRRRYPKAEVHARPGYYAQGRTDSAQAQPPVVQQ
ncbi:VWA domain-containing protein [Paludibaculum fermentans]|uniref:VWA domain-containing protein n=1 Tax=Paludibaculum fermentans TaxID=1473598 RepID=UPI003EBD95B2